MWAMFQIAIKMACSIGTLDSSGLRRAAIRRYLAARVGAVGCSHRHASVPCAAFRYGFPCRVLVDSTSPADSWLPGQVPAQNAEWAAVENTDMSAPVVAVITSAVRTPMLGMVPIGHRRRENGSITTSIRSVGSAMAWLRWSITSRYILATNARWSLNRPVDAPISSGIFA